MAITTTCQACDSTFKVRDAMAGKLGKCPRCGQTFRVTPTDGPASKPPVRSRPAAPSSGPLPKIAVEPAARPQPAAPKADDRLAAYRTRRRSLPVWIWFVLGGIGLAAALGAAVYSNYGRDEKPVAEQTPGPRFNPAPMVPEKTAPKRLPTLKPGASREDVVEFCKWSVVKIDVYEDQWNPHQGIGSGVIIDRSGLVATNYHVMETADKADVLFKDGTRFGVLGYVAVKPEYDLCIIQLNGVPEFVRPLKIQPEGDPRDASEVIAIGHPHDFRFVATRGMVNAVVSTRDLPRQLQGFLGSSLGDMPDNRWIQHDAATHPGNSGGPLLNLKGEVIGINSWITDRLKAGNFAIHARHLRETLRDRFADVKPLREFRRPPQRVRVAQATDSLPERLRAAFDAAAATGWQPANTEQYKAICNLAEAVTSVRLLVLRFAQQMPAERLQTWQLEVEKIQQALNAVGWDDDRIHAMNQMAAQADVDLQYGTCFFGTVTELYEGESPMLRVNIDGSDRDVLMPVAVRNTALLQTEIAKGDRLLVLGIIPGEQPIGANPAQQERIPVVLAGHVARLQPQ